MSYRIDQIAATRVLPKGTDYAEVGNATPESAKTLLQNFPQKVGTLANLTALSIATAADGVCVFVTGGAAAGDGKAGLYRYSSASAAAADGFFVLAPDAGAGRWLRTSQTPQALPTAYALPAADDYLAQGGATRGEGKFLRSSIAHTVQTYAALAALSVTTVPTGICVEVLGGAAAGDGGGGVFYYDSASAATANTATVIAPGVGAGRWLRIYSGPMSVKWFGAKGDRFTDDTAALQAAIDYAETLRGALDDSLVYPALYFPSGVYLVTAGLTINKSRISLIGDGPSNSVITRTGDFGDTLTIVPLVTGGVNSVGSYIIRDLGFYADTAPTSGAALRLQDNRHIRIQNVNIENTFGGIRIIGGGVMSFGKIEIDIGKNFTAFRANSYGIKIESSPTHTYPYPSLLTEQVNAQGWTLYADKGLWILSADGEWFNNCHFGGFKYNCHVYGSAAANIKGLFFSQTYFDGFFAGNPTLENILIENGDGTAAMETYQFSNCEVVGANYLSAVPHRGCNLHVNNAVKNVMFTGCHFGYAGGIGIWFNFGAPFNFAFSNCIVSRSAQASAGQQEILIEGTAKGISFIGGQIGELGYAAVSGGPALIQANAEQVTFDGTRLFGFGVLGIIDTTGLKSSRYVNIGSDIDSTMLSIASAATIAFRAQGDFYLVTGNTAIGNVSGPAWYGRRVTLVFASNPVVSAGANLALVGGVFNATADDTLTLVYNGTKWVEIARTVI